MRRGVWVVLGLVGMAPVGALAQQAQRQPSGQGDTAPPIIVEMPATAAPIASDRAARRSEPDRSRAATGGSGRSPSRSAQAAMPDEEIFVGTVRAVTGDRLRMVGATGRVYEFGLDRQTRIIGPNGAAVSIQAVPEGAPVRAVTREGGGFENQVVTLQIFGGAPAPAR